MTDSLDSALMLADSLASQSRLNDAVARALYAVTVTQEKGEADVETLASEVAALNERMAKLTETVAGMMTDPDSSVRVAS